MSIHTIVRPLAAAAFLGTAGCEATFTPAPVEVAYETEVAPAPVVPYDISAYPHVYFGGSWVYLVDGTWYYPTHRGWMVYREEPRELARIRTRIQGSGRVEAAPGYTAPSRRPTYQAPYQAPHETGRQRTPE